MLSFVQGGEKDFNKFLLKGNDCFVHLGIGQVCSKIGIQSSFGSIQMMMLKERKLVLAGSMDLRGQNGML
jgi:hypothetical protein